MKKDAKQQSKPVDLSKPVELRVAVLKGAASRNLLDVRTLMREALMPGSIGGHEGARARRALLEATREAYGVMTR